ncbi:autophagy-related protein 2B-like [Tropilaelaps mercedesae]|uniref:Autophagy-related protein 2 n=1 Tax=Tropilaelaps mercedesae TaxID=418985 RepID=A0A1V9XX21_9ACAR|nr:autophagy-related protein 2B-like [Tropilaelaps mercedesae]
MSWFSFSESIKKRLCRYVLQRYLGQFLLEKISLDQLSLDLSSNSGSAEITNVYLDVKGLNELSEAQHWPVQFIDGYIGTVRVDVPWKNILSDNSRVHVSGLMLTVQPKTWAEAEEASLFESMYSSMISSKQMAEEIFRTSEPATEPDALSGLEQFAVAIDTIFNRVIVSFEETTLRIEQMMHEGLNHFWTALEVKIRKLEYHDVLASSDNKTIIEEQASQSTKKIVLNGVELLVDKFNDAKRNEQSPVTTCGALCATSPEIESLPLTIAFLKGSQEVEVSLNHADRADHSSSPKIGVKVSLSELPIYIEPRQIMHLGALLSSFVGATDSDGRVQHESPCKALSSMDFAVMEQDLQGLVHNNGSSRTHPLLSDTVPSLPGLGSLGSQPHKWAGCGNEEEEDQYLPMMSTSDTQATSDIAPSVLNHSNMAVQSEFSLQIGTIYMVVLEDNTESQNDGARSKEFFKEIDGVPLRSIISVTTPSYLRDRHFRLVLHPLTLRGRTKSSSTQRMLDLALTVSNVDLLRGKQNRVESIFESHLKIGNTTKDQGEGPLPFLRLKVNHLYNNSLNSSRPEVSNVSCDFGILNLKYDRLLEARIVEMFGTQSAGASGSKKFEDYSARAHEISLNFSCPRLRCELRFQALEVANVRKELRPDALSITLEKIKVAGRISNEPHCNELKILFQSGFADYRPDTKKPDNVIQVVKVFSDPDVDDDGCGAASILIQINSTERNLLQENLMMDSMMHYSTMRGCSVDMTKSVYGKFLEDGPWKRRNVAPGDGSNGEEVILAGDRKLMQAFYEQCSTNAKMTVDIVLPTVVVEFANRELLEIIYNRVLIDLAYTPNYDCQQFVPPSDLDGARSFFERSINEKSYTGEQFFYSVAADEGDGNHKFRPVEQNLLCLSLTVQDSCVLLGHGSAERAEYFVFQFKPQQVQLYVVNAYQGDPNESFVMLHAADVEVHHEASSDNPMKTHSELNKDMMLPRDGTRLLLTRISKETFGAWRSGAPSQEMLCLLLKVHADPALRLKNITMAVSVAETAWRHEMTPSRQLWISQLIELATLRDLPVAGHVQSSVVTELHFNLEKSIIDYRPLYIPYGAIVSIENFSLSSNIVPKSTASTLRLIFEETYLFIAHNINKTQPPDLAKDYVCVIHADLLEFRLVLTGASRQASSSGSTAYLKSCAPPTSCSDSSAVLSFTASNNELQIRTCSDSLHALQAIASYLSTDGDLVATRERTHNGLHRTSPTLSTHRSPQQRQSQQLENGSPFSQSCQTPPSSTSVAEGIEDAMSDPTFDARSRSDERLSSFSSSSRSPSFDCGRESFLGETPGRVYYYPKDEDFLLLEDLPGSGLLRDKAKESVRVINSEEIVLIEDFLKPPSEKTDQFKAPDGYPNPTERYTFLQTKLIWYIYGGKDFEKAHAPGSRVADLKCLGGQSRLTNKYMDLTLTKISFRHEVYPPGENKSSRQCLYIKDIELIDKLPTSDCNKFLYQFSTDSLPRQSNANMVTLKVSHMARDNECSIFVSLKPLRFNIDQDALIFLMTFFSEVTSMASSAAQAHWSASVPTSAGMSADSSATYIRSFVFSPDVPIKIDYHGRHVTLDQGAIAGIIMGFGQFSCCELNLKKLRLKHGVLGFDKLMREAAAEWLNDIKANQLQNVAYSVGPMHPIIKLCSGFRDLLVLPILCYRKDGQIVRGLQKGTKSFGTNTALAFLDLTGRAITTIQQAAELAYNLLSPAASQPILPAVSDQPKDIMEGVHNAYVVMANGINDTARNLAAAAATDTRGSKGVSGAVGELLRQIPPSVMGPIIHATVATNNVLNGVKYQLDPGRRQEDLDKWKKPHNGKNN